ncbi:DUF1365 domain-containing protein [Aquihabitans daechungensis]|uniref:DUF1365 domain-containing protein n=1 Tax=Aquihabitans daechungensis TaxID=1052257 RepID=UPI003B9FB192
MIPPVHSALYEGRLAHARFGTPSHAFDYRVLMAWLDLAELPGALDAHPLWSARRIAPVRFRREDFHGDPGVPLDEAVRSTVQAASGRRPSGPIRMLAHLRTWGWSFNPIAFYFVFTPDGDAVDTLVAEVTNTPWHERHAYVLPIGATHVDQPIRFPKVLHVSPFMDLDLDHSLAFSPPGAEELTIRMDDWRGEDHVFAAELDLRRLPLDRPTMSRSLRQHPLPAQRVSAGIYWEALKLRAKHAPFRRHPHKVGAGRATSSLAPQADASGSAGCPVHPLPTSATSASSTRSPS